MPWTSGTLPSMKTVLIGIQLRLADASRRLRLSLLVATMSCLLMPQSIDLAHATGSHVAHPARCGGPRGQSIAFDASNLQTEPQYWVVYLIDASGTHLCAVPTPLRQDCTSPAWDPTGTTLLIDCQPRSLKKDAGSIYALSSTAVAPRLLTAETNGSAASWIDHGHHILYMSYRGGQGSWWTMAPDGSDRHPILGLEGYDLQGWDPNGDSLAGIAPRQVWGLWLLDRVGSVHRLIAQRYAYVAHVYFSPDGRSLAFSASADDKTTLYIADRDGSHIRAVAPLSVDSSIAWSPDSQSLAYTAPHSTGYALWVADSLGTHHRLLIDLNAGDESGEITPASPSWLADGRAVVISTFTGHHFDIVRISPDGRARATITPAAPPFDLLYDVACQPQ